MTSPASCNEKTTTTRGFNVNCGPLVFNESGILFHLLRVGQQVVKLRCAVVLNNGTTTAYQCSIRFHDMKGDPVKKAVLQEFDNRVLLTQRSAAVFKPRYTYKASHDFKTVRIMVPCRRLGAQCTKQDEAKALDLLLDELRDFVFTALRPYANLLHPCDHLEFGSGANKVFVEDPFRMKRGSSRTKNNDDADHFLGTLQAAPVEMPPPPMAPPPPPAMTAPVVLPPAMPQPSFPMLPNFAFPFATPAGGHPQYIIMAMPPPQQPAAPAAPQFTPAGRYVPLAFPQQTGRTVDSHRFDDHAEHVAITFMRTELGLMDATKNGRKRKYNGDGGIDVVSARAVAQVKANARTPVPRALVSQLMGDSVEYTDVAKLFFAFSYTDDARDHAKKHGVILFQLDIHGRVKRLM